MRVLTFLHSFEPGGVERIALRLVRRWRETGIDAPLFLGRTDGAMAEDVGAGLDFVTPPRRWPGIAHWETIWMVLTLPRVVRAVRPDMLFCAGNTYAFVAVMLKLILGRDCPPVVAKISNNLDRTDASRLYRAFYRIWLRIQGLAIDHFVGMEKPMRAEIVQGVRVSPARVAIIPDPALSEAQIMALREPLPAPIRSDGRRFVTIARLAPQKNLALMLRGFARGARAHDTLTLFGDGPERPALEALAVTLGIADRVDFRGYVTNPAALLGQYDMLLLSSHYEGVPAVILEGLAANIGIIATDCSRSMAALLQQGALGTLVPVGDEAAFADAIATARPHAQDARRTLHQARRFTIEHGADHYVRVMRGVLRSKRAPAPLITEPVVPTN
ncbi:glycosyltransferase [Sphingomonas sp. SORGH_AS_0879]|uniref:glycosyltransferase n=1 Tax=Sphingomonas sp. SORGH_AS_0879 TaxID=3041790 RepID=UPI0027840DFC|nr:glycosyltransferase [Sphingomonas sp. SORGH_AS_0879]MDQ1228637.1 glycosyltransferase involved in cell wall biosynthesis [Sphingomonas sp. SORGH_AS_0879]